MSFEYFETPAIPVPKKEWWRDPKILEMDDGTYCMVVYETEYASFYTSEDLHNWVRRSTADNIVECPDLFKLPVMETGETLWVLYGGDGKYRIGAFEDFRFIENGHYGHMDYGNAVYAGQTWSSHPDKTVRHHIAWVRRGGHWNVTVEGNRAFSQCMSTGCVLSLHKTAEGYRLFRNPVEALKGIRESKVAEGTHNIKGNWEISLEIPCDVMLELDTQADFKILMEGSHLSYSAESNKIETEEKSYVLSERKKLQIRLIADMGVNEFFIGGEISATFSYEEKGIFNVPLVIESDDVKLSYTVWSLKSIWNKS